ncbi:hypothetical protein E2I00_011616, partial [Balaenoptera physalus]
DLPCVLGLWALLALPGVLGSGSGAKDSPGSSSSLGSPEEDPERQEDEQDAEDDYDLGGGHGEREPQEGTQHGEGPSPQQAPEPAEEAYDEDAEGGLGLGSQGPVGSRGSAEALLSDLHAFAGSAAWDDSTRASGGQGLHVTAL